MPLGTSELLIIAILIVVVFGATALPKFARNLGRGKAEIDKLKQQVEETAAPLTEGRDQLKKATAQMRKAERTLKSPAKSFFK